MPGFPCRRAKVRFAADSPLEGARFELPVPRAIRLRFPDFALGYAFDDVHRRQPQIIERRCGRARIRSGVGSAVRSRSELGERPRLAAQAGDYPIWPPLRGSGTGSSNPSPSSGESANHRFRHQCMPTASINRSLRTGVAAATQSIPRDRRHTPRHSEERQMAGFVSDAANIWRQRPSGCAVILARISIKL
jgi:hypothetical protein